MKYISFAEYSSEIEFDWLVDGQFDWLVDGHQRIMNSDHRYNVNPWVSGQPPSTSTPTMVATATQLTCDGHFVCENGSEFKVCLCNGDDSIVFVNHSTNPDSDLHNFLEWLNKPC